MFNRYFYAKDNNGNNISAEEYKKIHSYEIELINKSFQNDKFITKCIYRLILKGTNCDYKISGIIYSIPDDYLFISSYDIRKKILFKFDMKSSGVDIRPLFIQPKDRNLNNNSKYEKARHIVQIKWFSLFDDIMQVYYNKNSMF